MPSSILNSDDGVISGTAGLKNSGGDDGVLLIQTKGVTAATVSASQVFNFVNPPTGIPTATIATTAEAQAGTNNTAFITPLRLREGFNASGTAPVFACRAWVNFNGSGGVTINGSGNIASVTRTSSGQYFATFTTNMPDINFAFVGSASIATGNFGLVPGDESASRTVSRTGSFFTVNTTSVNSAADANNINIAIFR